MLNQALLNSTTDLMWSVDREYRLTVGNKAFISSLEIYQGIHYEPNDCLLSKGSFPDEYLAFWKDLYDQAFGGKTVLEEVISPKNERQDIRWYEINIHPIYQEKEIIGVACFGRDITQRKIALDTLEENEERYRILVENAPEALVVLDFNLKKFVSVSQSAIELFKMSREVFLQSFVWDITPEYQHNGQLSSAIILDKINQAIAGEKPFFECNLFDSE